MCALAERSSPVSQTSNPFDLYLPHAIKPVRGQHCDPQTTLRTQRDPGCCALFMILALLGFISCKSRRCYSLRASVSRICGSAPLRLCLRRVPESSHVSRSVQLASASVLGFAEDALCGTRYAHISGPNAPSTDRLRVPASESSRTFELIGASDWIIGSRVSMRVVGRLATAGHLRTSGSVGWLG